MNIPTGLKYTKSDEWVKVEGSTATVGISDYAQEQLSDVVFVEILVEPGQNARKGITCASIESVKAAADVNLPVSGTVAAVNDGLSATPEVLNSDPYNVGWMLRIELSDPAELDTLMDASAYEAYCQEREH